MKKKLIKGEYLAPEVKVVKLKTEFPILTGSPNKNYLVDEGIFDDEWFDNEEGAIEL